MDAHHESSHMDVNDTPSMVLDTRFPAGMTDD